MDSEDAARLVKLIKETERDTPQRAQAQAELEVLIAREFSEKLAQLSSEIQEVTEALSSAAAGSSRQAEALVRYTKAYVAATVALVVIGAASIAVTVLAALGILKPY